MVGHSFWECGVKRYMKRSEEELREAISQSKNLTSVLKKFGLTTSSGPDGEIDRTIPRGDYVVPAHDYYSYQLKFGLSHYGIRMDQQVFIGPETIDHLLFLLVEAKKGWARNKQNGYRPDPKYVPRNRDGGSSEIKRIKFPSEKKD